MTLKESPAPNGSGPRLLVFGRVQLLGDDGAPLADLLAQTKPLALLAHLVLAEPTGFHRRDRLVSLFWPELDAERARSALRKAVYLVRRQLGDAAIASRGEEEVGVPLNALWCDAIEFVERLAVGHLARAMELYRGELLPGLFIREAHEFQDWLDGARANYQRQASTAAWMLAARSEADANVTNAADWARKSVALAPLDERLVRKTLALLGRSGDRAGAVALYDAFQTRLLRDFDVQPDPETAALIRQIRDRR